MNITKAALVAVITKTEDLPKRQVTRIVDHLFNLITQNLANGHEVELRGFGAWRVSQWQGRNWNHPDGRFLKIPAKRHVKFKPGRILAEKLRQNISNAE